jgi:hypothetical protein
VIRFAEREREAKLRIISFSRSDYQQVTERRLEDGDVGNGN